MANPEEHEKSLRTESLVAPASGTTPAAPASAADLAMQAYRDGEKRIAEFCQRSALLELKLSLAVSRGDEDEAGRFIAAGADVDFRQEGRLPLIHEAIGLGHKSIVAAILASGRCDLTVRDHMGRLASHIAGSILRDHELADHLAAEQARQFREKGIDPRGPDNPVHGNWRWAG